MKVYCNIEGVYKGFRELQSFNPIVAQNWSKDVRIFPMFDIDTLEVFECGFNREFGDVVAFAEVPMNEFRRKVSAMAEKVMKQAISEAMKQASDDVVALYSELQMLETLRDMTIKRE